MGNDEILEHCESQSRADFRLKEAEEIFYVYVSIRIGHGVTQRTWSRNFRGEESGGTNCLLIGGTGGVHLTPLKCKNRAKIMNEWMNEWDYHDKGWEEGVFLRNRAGSMYLVTKTHSWSPCMNLGTLHYQSQMRWKKQTKRFSLSLSIFIFIFLFFFAFCSVFLLFCRGEAWILGFLGSRGPASILPYFVPLARSQISIIHLRLADLADLYRFLLLLSSPCTDSNVSYFLFSIPFNLFSFPPASDPNPSQVFLPLLTRKPSLSLCKFGSFFVLTLQFWRLFSLLSSPLSLCHWRSFLWWQGEILYFVNLVYPFPFSVHILTWSRHSKKKEPGSLGITPWYGKLDLNMIAKLWASSKVVGGLFI